MKQIKRILKLFFFLNFKLFPPLKKKILLWDVNGENELNKLVKKKDYEILHRRLEQINIYILIRSIIKYKSIKKINYLLEFINFINPKILITFIDNDISFYKIKISPLIKKIVVQNAWRSAESNEISYKYGLKKQKEKFNINYMFVFNKYIKKNYENFTNSFFFLIGGIRSNNYKIINKKKNTIFFIFQLIEIEKKARKFQKILLI